MSQEGSYNPSQEETKKAEEQMTSSQAYLSKNREYSREAMAELGVDGFLETVATKTVEGLPDKVTGVINGHNVEIWEDGFRSGVMVGTIDGVKLSTEATNKILDKYKDRIAYHEPSIMSRAKGEKVDEETLLGSIGVE